MHCPRKVGFVCGRATRIVAAMNETERLTRLEERYAHLQRHQAEQDKAMLELTDEVAKLRQEISVLRARVPGGPETDELPEERPPHY
jgi:SlyX protein